MRDPFWTAEAARTRALIESIQAWPSDAARRRAHAWERAVLVAALGWERENEKYADERYAASTGELVRWVRE